MTYDLTRLGSTRFEHLVQALALGYLGHGVEIFGAGPDSGREATFRGEVIKAAGDQTGTKAKTGTTGRGQKTL